MLSTARADRSWIVPAQTAGMSTLSPMWSSSCGPTVNISARRAMPHRVGGTANEPVGAPKLNSGPGQVAVKVYCSTESVAVSRPVAHHVGVERTEEDRLIGEVVDRLRKVFPDVPEPAVAEAVTSSRRRFDNARIRDFVPLFVERNAKENLAVLARNAQQPA
jgi:hypothetical protein